MRSSAIIQAVLAHSVNASHDIEVVIRDVRAALPAVIVEQLHQPHPADDNGLWVFRLPGSRGDIQVESSTYDCPFLVEQGDVGSTAEALTAASVPETVAAVVSYLRSTSSVP